MEVEFDKYVDITDDRPGKDAAYLLNSDRLRQSLNWKDSVSLSEGIDNTIEWVEDNFDTLEKQQFEYIHKK